VSCGGVCAVLQYIRLHIERSRAIEAAHRSSANVNVSVCCLRDSSPHPCISDSMHCGLWGTPQVARHRPAYARASCGRHSLRPGAPRSVFSAGHQRFHQPCEHLWALPPSCRTPRALCSCWPRRATCYLFLQCPSTLPTKVMFACPPLRPRSPVMEERPRSAITGARTGHHPS